MVTWTFRRPFAAGLAPGLGLAGITAAGVAVAATSSTSVLHACVAKQDGAIRSRCPWSSCQ